MIDILATMSAKPLGMLIRCPDAFFPYFQGVLGVSDRINRTPLGQDDTVATWTIIPEIA